MVQLETAAHIQQLSADYFWLCYLVGGQIASDVQASSFRALGGLEPGFFWDFGLRAGSGSAKFASDGRAGGYLCTYKNIKL